MANAEAVARSCSVKKVLLNISQSSLENTCARISFFNKVAGLRPPTLFKKRLAQVFSCFPVNFAKFLRTPFYIEHLWWMLLQMVLLYMSKVFFLETLILKVTQERNSNYLKE